MMYTTRAAKKAAGRRLCCRDRQNWDMFTAIMFRSSGSW
jgi:hypothetical protein